MALHGALEQSAVQTSYKKESVGNVGRIEDVFVEASLSSRKTS